MTMHVLLDLTHTNTTGGLSNYIMSKDYPLNIYYDNILHKEGIKLNTKSSFNSIFFEAIKEYYPVFSFFVRKVDKSVRKNSRGKSGKYVII
jgi:hypothetical protein